MRNLFTDRKKKTEKKDRKIIHIYLSTVVIQAKIAMSYRPYKVVTLTIQYQGIVKVRLILKQSMSRMEKIVPGHEIFWVSSSQWESLYSTER